MAKFVVERRYVAWERISVEAESVEEAVDVAVDRLNEGRGTTTDYFEPTGHLWVESEGSEWTFTDGEMEMK
jgi:hypothetical protein